MYTQDYHMHSIFSPDGAETIDDICKKAISANIDDIAITDHFDNSAQPYKSTAYRPDQIYKEICAAREAYGKQLKIKFGIEVGEHMHFLQNAAQLLADYEYDFVLSSVHCVRGGVDFFDMNFKKGCDDALLQKYFLEILDLAKNGDFDCLAHLDLPRRYAARHGTVVRCDLYKDIIEEILKSVISRGKGIEINTSGYRQQLKDFLPSKEVLKLYRALGGEILTIGSDAHRTPQIGCNVTDAMDYARELGFAHIAAFEARIPSFVKI